jgi:hypothetical protein
VGREMMDSRIDPYYVFSTVPWYFFFPFLTFRNGNVEAGVPILVFLLVIMHFPFWKNSFFRASWRRWMVSLGIIINSGFCWLIFFFQGAIFDESYVYKLVLYDLFPVFIGLVVVAVIFNSLKEAELE